MKLIDFDEYFSKLSKRDREIATRRYNELRAVYQKECEEEDTLLGKEESRIDMNSKAKPGKPSIRGMRITVDDILEYLGNGNSEEDLLEDFPYLEAEDIRAAYLFEESTKGK